MFSKVVEFVNVDFFRAKLGLLISVERTKETFLVDCSLRKVGSIGLETGVLYTDVKNYRTLSS